jgi:hypothetical protein
MANAHFMRCGGMRRSFSYCVAVNHSFRLSKTAPAREKAPPLGLVVELLRHRVLMANQGLLLVTHLAAKMGKEGAGLVYKECRCVGLAQTFAVGVKLSMILRCI